MWGMLARRASRQQGEEAGRLLYLQAVAAARKPHFYRAGGVPDTLDGRFDMICLMAALLVRRLRRTAPALAQSVFDAMFRDMDASLRELGVGDLGVPRRVGAMWQAFNGPLPCLRGGAAGGGQAALVRLPGAQHMARVAAG